MCGIIGAAASGGKINRKSCLQMLRAINHRGSDGQGIWENPKVFLAMKRLSIIDIEGGQQPLYNEDKSIVIVGNGEIYNYPDLSKIIKRRHHKLRTRSDIEAVVHLYEDEGVNFLKRLKGMFALAIVDQKKQKLILARDRMGEKPLYWTMVRQALVFSSEIKSILSYQGIDKTLNRNSFVNYFQYYYVPGPETMFESINKLPPGCYLIFDLKTGKIEKGKYWNPSEIEVTSNTNPTADIREAFTEACRLTLRSDVPVAISLSGGLDSSAILSVSNKLYKGHLKAFSIGYENSPRTDERQNARWLANKLGVEFIDGEIRKKEVVDDFPQLVYDCDEPVADIAAHSIRAVAKLARENGFKVLVGGLGGDELFWGYGWVRNSLRDNKINSGNFKFYENTKSFVSANQFISLLIQPDLKDLMTQTNMSDMPTDLSKVGLGKFGLGLIRDRWLVANCLVLADRLSMANSVELRSPFMDRDLIELVLGNRQTVLGYQKDSKYWLKKALAGIVPKEVIERPKTGGFTPPVASWLFGIIGQYSHLLDDGFLVQEQILDQRKIRFIRRIWMALPLWWYPIYQLILLEIWGREFVGSTKAVDIV